MERGQRACISRGVPVSTLEEFIATALSVLSDQYLLPVRGVLRICISTRAEPLHLVQVLKKHEVVPASPIAEVLELLIVQLNAAAENLVVFECKHWVVIVHVHADIFDNLVGSEIEVALGGSGRVVHCVL